MSNNKKSFHFVSVTDEDIKRETLELVRNIKEEKITDFIFEGEHLYTTGNSGHAFGRGWYIEHITKSGIRATFYTSGLWIINDNNYKHNEETNEFKIIPNTPTTEINWDEFSFPVVKNVSARTLAQDIIPYTPKKITIVNTLDKQYTVLLQDILDNGVEKKDRTGTGTISVFGRQIRHKMSEGFPLLTTKKMAFKTMVTELIWFLRGDTNIKYLVDNNCHIWDGDCFSKYNKLMKNNEWRYENRYNFNWFTRDRESEFHMMSGPAYRPLTKEEFINKIKTDDEFAEMWGELGPVYGKQWRKWEGREWMHDNQSGIDFLGTVYTDQIANLINDLKTNPDSRRLMVSAWNVGELDQMVLPPCHYGFQVYTRELSEKERMKLAGYEDVGGIGQNIIRETVDMDNTIPRRAISLMWNQRSVDTFLGLPFNIASYGLLLEIIAKEVNMVPDELIGNLGDVHLYSNHIKQAKEQIGREPFELPQLSYLDEYHYLNDSKLVGEISFSEKIKQFRPSFFKVENYQSHPAIKAPLSN